MLHLIAVNLCRTSGNVYREFVPLDIEFRDRGSLREDPIRQRFTAAVIAFHRDPHLVFTHTDTAGQSRNGLVRILRKFCPVCIFHNYGSR